MVARHGVFPIRLPGANRVEEVAEVQDGGVRAVVLEFLGLGMFGVFGRLDLSGDDFGIAVVGVFERLRPAIDDPAVICSTGISG